MGCSMWSTKTLAAEGIVLRHFFTQRNTFRTSS